MSDSFTSALTLLSDGDLARMTERAYRESGRLFAEYRAEPAASPIKAMLLESAQSEGDYWLTLGDEQRRRGCAPSPSIAAHS